MRVPALAAIVLIACAIPAAAESNQRRPLPPSLKARLIASSPLRDAIQRDDSRVLLSARRSVKVPAQPQRPETWIRRHPACVGSLIGFVAGFAIGYLPGDDGVFYDFDASFNGLVIGGVGAAVGAIAGAALGK